MVKDDMGDRFKCYEAVTRTILLPHSYTVIRVDGARFHGYLKDAEKPYDLQFIKDMMQAGVDLCQEVSGTILAYGQSDEISVVLQDLEPQSQPWFGGIVQKMVSISAAIATASLMASRDYHRQLPLFDSRVFTLPSAAEVQNYLIWRQKDAVRNSISMAAQAKFSPKQLHGVGSGQMQEMLFSEHGINWNDYPAECRRGWVVTKESAATPHSYVDKRNPGTRVFSVIERSFWMMRAAERFVFWSPTSGPPEEPEISNITFFEQMGLV